MDVVDAIKAELLPKTGQLVSHLKKYGDDQAHSFFEAINSHLAASHGEDDIAEVFMALSTAAFQGFVLDPKSSVLADDILVSAGRFARTLSADSGKIN